MRRKSLTTFAIQRFFTYSVFLLYFLSSQILIPLNNGREVFPFFHWNLFSEANPQKTVFHLKILRSGIELNIPERLRSKRFFFLIQDAGRIGTSDLASPLFAEKNRQIQDFLRQELAAPFVYELYESTVDLNAPRDALPREKKLWQSEALN